MDLSEYEFHHLGYAVNSVRTAAQNLGAVGWRKGDIFEDKNQGVRGMFMELGNAPQIELLENMPGETTLDGFLKTGGFVCYHMGYFVEDMERVILQSRRAGGKLIRPPIQAAAFGGRRICFFIFRGGIIIEWIHKNSG